MDYKTFILFTLLASLLLFSGCAGKEVVCNKPYIPVGSNCCIDRNNNEICDSDDTTTTTTTTTTTLPEVIYDYTGGVTEFDGVDDYVSISLDSSLAFNSKPFTITTWVKFGNLDKSLQTLFNSNPHAIMDIAYNHDASRKKVLSLWLCSDNKYWDIAEGATGSKSDYNTYDWYYVTLLWDGSYYKVYVNGILDISVPSTRATYLGNVGFTLGHSSGPPEYFQGKIGDFRIYKRALIAEELKNNYLTELGKYESKTYS